MYVLRAASCLTHTSLCPKLTLDLNSPNPPLHTHHKKDAKGFVYFASATVYKIATGNANGPSSTAPSLINSVDFSAGYANDGTVMKC